MPGSFNVKGNQTLTKDDFKNFIVYRLRVIFFPKWCCIPLVSQCGIPFDHEA